MACPRCVDNPPDARFCSFCGGGLSRKCPKCSGVARADANFCHLCGHPVTPGVELYAAPVLSPAPMPPDQPEREAELRQVTLLFARIKGLDEEQGLVTELAQKAVHAMSQAVQRYEGLVIESNDEGI